MLEPVGKPLDLEDLFTRSSARSSCRFYLRVAAAGKEDWVTSERRPKERKNRMNSKRAAEHCEYRGSLRPERERRQTNTERHHDGGERVIGTSHFGDEHSKKVRRAQGKWWSKRLVHAICETRQFAKPCVRGHNQTADTWVNKGAEGQVKMWVDGQNIKGHWDGSAREDGSIGCGVVIRSVDRVEWFTVCEVALPRSEVQWGRRT